MVRSDIRLISTLSGSNFHQKIIKKYQTDKWNTFRFPIMIFCKTAGHFFPKKINMEVLLRLRLNYQNIVSSLIVKSLPAMKGMFSWFNAEKIILQPIGERKNIPSINKISEVSFLKYMFRVENLTTELNRILNPLLMTSNAAFYRQAFHTIFKDSKNVNLQSLTANAALYRQAFRTIFKDIKNLNPQLLNYKYSTQILNSQKFRVGLDYRSSNTTGNHTPIDYENTHKYQSTVEYKLHSILSQENLLFNKNTTILRLFNNSTKLSVNGLFFKGLNRETVNKPLINNYYYSFGNGASSSVQRKYAPITGSENLFFQDQGHMEQEIENIKKIVIETKESVLDKSKPSLGEAEIKKYLDINRISDQVYRNIERTIRMERERRGI